MQNGGAAVVVADLARPCLLWWLQQLALGSKKFGHSGRFGGFVQICFVFPALKKTKVANDPRPALPKFHAVQS